jgi:asparagine synthase (glutamine-hydrolysing)
MNWSQRHRGPDDEGYLFIDSDAGVWCAAGGKDTDPSLGLRPHQTVETRDFDLALGSRRLAILDLSPAGHMPMHYLEGTLWLTYNGEIYNYRELRKELEGLGYTFSSYTDTEVILAAYAQWGVECLARFNGMFAFALWDNRTKRLFCARDRFGVKPFYFYWNGSTFVFASEIKALLRHPAVPQMPNDQMIFDYLVRGRSDHTDQTFFEGIYSLSAGHFLVVNVPARELFKQQWWKLNINPNLDALHLGDEQVYAEFSHLLEDAIRKRLRTDVAVGSCLSGGLDSSTIVCMTNRLLTQENVIPSHLVGDHQKTFTARNKEAEIDEYRYSHLIVEQTGADEHIVFPSGETLWQEIEPYLWHLDEPVDSTSQYLQWNVMRLARQHGVTVLLDGQGGDEILAGYYAYYPAYVSQIRQQRGRLAAMQAGLAVSRAGGAPVANMLFDHAKYRLPWRLQSLITRLIPPRMAPGHGGTGLKEWQLSSAFSQRFSDRRWHPEGPIDSDGLAGILHRDLISTNLPKLLRFEDRNSMAFSLETRLPFLDYRLVEMVFSLPLDFRIHNGWSKWILRHSMRDTLPAEITWRRSKMGFPTPESKWLRKGSAYIRQLLSANDNERLAAYIQPGVLQRIREQSDDELPATPGLWRIINLIVWLNLFFEHNAMRDSDDLRAATGERPLRLLEESPV